MCPLLSTNFSKGVVLFGGFSMKKLNHLCHCNHRDVATSCDPLIIRKSQGK